jgi:hypothetical protein
MTTARRLGPAALLCALIFLQGCASTARINQARTLAGAAGGVSDALFASSAAVEDAFQTGLKQNRLLNGLQAGTVPPEAGVCSYVGKTSSETARIEQPDNAVVGEVASALAARRGVAAALRRTYASFDALAQYDASGEVEKGLTDTVAAVNELREAVGLGAFSPAVGTIISAGGGMLAAHAQASRLEAGSARMREVLAAYREGLIKGQQRNVAILQDEVHGRYTLAIALWRRGYMNADPLVASLGAGGGTGLVLDPKKSFTAADEQVCRAVKTYLEVERDQKALILDDEYSQQIATVGALIKAHEDFENSKSLSVGELTAEIARLTDLAKKLGGE